MSEHDDTLLDLSLADIHALRIEVSSYRFRFPRYLRGVDPSARPYVKHLGKGSKDAVRVAEDADRGD